jgi:membrane-associated phospholipid phosphatase
MFYLGLGLCLGCMAHKLTAQTSDAALPDAPRSALENAPPAAMENHHGGDGTYFDGTVTWKQLPGRFGRDQKAIWLSPRQLAKGRGWVPMLVVVGGTAGLIEADPHVMPYFRDHATNLDDLNDVFDKYITTGEVVALPVALLGAGYIRHDSYMTSTAMLAGVAYADSAIVDLAAKAVTRRERPSDVPAGADFTDTFFNGAKSPLKGSSFPSGHATGAFSVATVVATRYKNHKWVPWAAYGFATAISLSRITTLAHFPSDVFLGAALGYTTTRFQVLRPE